MITRGQGGWGEAEEGKGGSNIRLQNDVNTQCNTQMMYYRIEHLKTL